MRGVVLLRAVEDREQAPGAPAHLLLDEPSMVALGQALHWRSSSGGRLLGLSAGPAAWESVLRDSLALGLDDVTRVAVDEGGEADVASTADAIASALPGDTRAVFAGCAATDHGSGTLAAALAGVLDWPLLTDVTAASGSAEALVAEVRAGAGRRRTYEVKGPAILAAAKGAPPPLYPPLARRFAAAKASIDVIQVELGSSEARLSFLGFGPARPRTRHLLKPDTGARAGDRLSQLMSGGAQQRSGSKIGGEAPDLARQLADVLDKAGLLPP
jgi:electron transfer flavoprotein alpha/beta subunit